MEPEPEPEQASPGRLSSLVKFIITRCCCHGGNRKDSSSSSEGSDGSGGTGATRSSQSSISRFNPDHTLEPEST